MLFFLEVLKHTPISVYLLLFFLLFVGFKSMQEGTVNIYLVGLPSFSFFLFSLKMLFLERKFGFLIYVIWCFGLIVGYLVGWYHSHVLFLSVGNKPGTVKVKGSYVMLITVLLLFCSRYYLGYIKQTHNDYFQLFYFAIVMIFYYGVCTGFFTGRMNYFWIRLKKR